MSLSFKIVLLVAINFCSVIFAGRGYVTYEFSGGRFGDNLVAYLHAKWISYQYQIPLLYKPFPYSCDLLIDDIEIPYDQINKKTFLGENFFESSLFKYNLGNKQTIYNVPYFPESKWERNYCKDGHGNPWKFFNVDWSDLKFRKLVKEVLLPKENLVLVKPKPDSINIAIHYREGGGFDTGDFNLGFLTKFPPVSFYLQGLLKVIRIFKEQPLYCYVFTDARNPLEFIELIKSKIPPEANIVFDFRASENFHNKNVLEDFFSLFNFDVLIHSESNFSFIPSAINDYLVTYTITSAHLEGRRSFVDEIKFKINEKLCKERIEEMQNNLKD